MHMDTKTQPHTETHECADTRTHIYITHRYTCTHRHACSHRHTCTHVHTGTPKQTHTQRQTHICSYGYKGTHTGIYTDTWTQSVHIYACTNTFPCVLRHLCRPICLQVLRILCSRIAVTANSVPAHRKRSIISVFVCKCMVKTIFPL